ncbi:RCC1 domain-containing protein [Paenibacillus glycanilyticus]|uniref:Copper amine oxidase-like N-terminal domain-containing protein n=1 Tax=Paenibacillus glycanilyticus TaxID=126569 RepID=A0ABQ6G6R1_9BACL|nr:hypothetical protein [Paenibacillus glycanilyticus]GLX65975.1 hypothetical protein MU1_03190 [Paenibacillus glycanilyticus]
MQPYRSRFGSKPIITLMMAFLLLVVSPLPGRALAEQAANAKPAFTQIIAGTYYSAALRNDGSVWVWGRNLWSELGIQEQAVSTSVAAPVRLAGLTDIVALSTNKSGYQLAVKRDGTIWEWGTSLEDVKKGILPRQLNPLSGMSNAIAGTAFGFGLRSDGTVWAWPRSKEPSAGGAEVTVLPAQVSGLANVEQITSVGDTVYVQKSDGSVWQFAAKLDTSASGSNEQVQLTTPAKIAGLPAVRQFAPYYNGALVIDLKGQTWKVEWNSGAKPKLFHPELKVKTISIGANSLTLLLTQSGAVYSVDRFNSTDKGKKIRLATPIQAIAAGAYHGLALDGEGRVFGWGADNWNETGGPAKSPDHMVYAPMQIRRDITMTANGKPLATIFPAIMEGSSISVPLKDALRSIGGDYQVTVNGNAQSVMTISYKGKQYAVQYQGSQVLLNGVASGVTVPANSGSASGVTMMPCGVLKKIGISCTWNAQTGTLAITG